MAELYQFLREGQATQERAEAAEERVQLRRVLLTQGWRP
jgi:hypothetical protein